PLPTLTWNGYSWSARVRLPSWAGFQSRGGSYGSIDSHEPSTGTVELSVGGEQANQSVPPSPEMAAAFGYLTEHEAEVAQVVIAAVADEARRLLDNGLVEDRHFQRSLKRAARGGGDLRKVVGLNAVHILGTSHDGVAYVGFELGCDWEEEHGLGVLTHRNRI